MSVIREIYEWSKGLPEWQSDAIRRIYERDALSEQDIEDLAALAKAQTGIEDPEARVPHLFQEGQVPHDPEGRELVSLLAMRDLENVNAIAPEQTLNFAEQGLTVVYGDNAAGKSGYARVLKRACRARDENEAVLPDARQTATATPTATIDFTVGGECQSVVWTEGVEPPAVFSNVAVLDTRSARVYLDEENELAVQPYGLDIPEKLASACEAAKSRIKREAEELIFDEEEFKDLQGQTAVGAAIARLSGDITKENFERLAKLEDLERRRLGELKQIVAESNPAAEAKRLARLKTRVKEIRTRTARVNSALGDKKVAELREVDSAWREANAAAATAGRQLTEGENLLPGTGGVLWKKLYEAAREFSVKEAYPDHEFPNVTEGARCVLCQQELDDGAHRLKRFDEFVRDKTATEARERETERAEVIKQIESLQLERLLDEATLSELEEVDPEAGDKVAAEDQWRARRQEILRCCESGDWSKELPKLPPVSDVLSQIHARLERKEQEYERLAKGDRAALERELAELGARDQLGQRIERLRAVIAMRDRRRALEKCANSISTRGISLKATELTEKVVTRGLEDALNREIEGLGLRGTSVKLSSRTVRGMTRHKLQLDMSSKYEVSQVLSEGEQRAIALASFLAESAVAGTQESIVFDDPVSSLDHSRREVVARRLTQEATERQVIVFTHDLYFLYLLQERSENVGARLLAQMVVVGSGGPGVVVEDLPFQGKSTKDRIGALRQQVQDADKLWRDNRGQDYERLVRDGYRKLRDAWERAVEELLFNSTVVRFRKGVETNRLRKVTIEPKDQKEVEDGMTKCSNHAHDRALEAGIEAPSPDEFREDVERLEAFRKRVNKRLN